MAQNRSHAVMAQRVEPAESLDHFPTPLWATRALCEWLNQRGEALHLSMAWEPACAEGYMARAMREYFAQVTASDVHDYGFGQVSDYLHRTDGASFDWIITNPPFNLAQQFAQKAIREAREGVALLTRISFLEGVRRHRELFSLTPPSDVLQFVERVPMFKGRLDRHGSTATAYCWLVWRHAAEPGTRFHWLAPCRARLERHGDYPEDRA